MSVEDRAWAEARKIILGTERHPRSAVTWALIAYRGHLMPGHPAIKLMESYREHLSGERNALTDEELAPLRERAA